MQQRTSGGWCRSTEVELAPLDALREYIELSIPTDTFEMYAEGVNDRPQSTRL